MLDSPVSAPLLVSHLVETLQELPGVHARIGRVDWAGNPLGDWPDPPRRATIALEVADRPLTVQVEARRVVYPRDARQAIWQMRDAGHDGSGSVVPLLLAESISPGAKDLLRREGVGYYDGGGSLYLPAAGVLLYIDKPPPRSQARSMRSLYAGRRAQVLHALLVQSQAWFGVNELAQLAQVSPATASQVLRELERLDWLATKGQGPSKERHLREPAALLDAWAKQLATERPPVLQRYYVPATKPEALAARLDECLQAREVPYAISHEAAAQRLAPFLSSVSQIRLRLLPGPAADAALAQLGARPVTEGANLALIDTKSAGELLFRERHEGLWLASPVQIYLDLMRSEGRAKELAAHFRKERMGF